MERLIARDMTRLTRDKILELYAQGQRDFHESILDELDLSGCCLRDCNLSGSSFIGTRLCASNLENSDLSRSDFTGACLSRANLSECDLSWAKFLRAELVGADLRKIKGRAANFSDALMLRTRMNDADCLGAILSGINATAAQMESVNFECVDLSGAALMNANLCGANLSWANITDARLNWANLSWCLMEAADLENANLTGACLQAANLSFANLEDAILTGADLYFTNLSGALLPDIQQPVARIASARLTSQTYTRSQWPRQMLRDWQNKGAIILDFEALPRDVQQFIREGECNLRLFFTTPVDKDARAALEVLMAHVTHDASLRILSICNENKQSQVAFYSSAPASIELFSAAFRTRSWNENAEALKLEFEDYQKQLHAQNMDILAVLNHLADHILHIQALVPVSEDDRTSRLQARLSLDECAERKAQISWSSISHTKVSR